MVGFSADLHPENILYDTRQTASEEPELRLTFIDAGIVSKLNPGDFNNLLNVSIAVMFNDADKFSRLIVEGSPDKYCSSMKGFKNALEKILDQLHKKDTSISEIDFVGLVKSFLRACAKFDVKLEQRLVYLVLGLTMLQGIGKQLHPDINLFAVLMPYVITAGQRYLTHRERWYVVLFSSERSFDRLT
jgi:predicted unusual protein kinase regulating ubiquinone biosynthesis (AarF/ABC1/UbiB family)